MPMPQGIVRSMHRSSDPSVRAWPATRRQLSRVAITRAAGGHAEAKPSAKL